MSARRFNWLSAGRRWRKTTLAMSIVVEAAVRGGIYLWCAPTYDQTRIGYAEVKKALGQVGEFNISRMTAEIPATGGTIVFRSLDDADNVRGYTADGVVIDEAAFVKGEAWHEVLRPMLIDTGGWAWGIGTPNGRNWFYREFAKARDHDDYMAWQIPTRGVKVVDGQLVPNPHPLENPDVPFEEIVQLWRSMTERVFEQEILGIFRDDAGGLFRYVTDAATAALQDSPVKGHQYVMGLDLARKVDYTVLATLDITNPGRPALVDLDRFGRVDWPVQIARVKAKVERFRPEALYADATGVGDPIVQQLQAELGHLPMAVEGVQLTRPRKVNMCDALALAFEQRAIEILPDDVLIDELQSFDATTYAAPEGSHDDTVISLAMAYWATRQPAVEVESLEENPFYS